MRAGNSLPRRQRKKMPATSRASKVIAISPDVWQHLNSRRHDGEAFEDVLRRLLGLTMRVL